MPPGMTDERIIAIEGARRRTPVSLSPTIPQGFRRIDTDRRGVPRQLQDLSTAPTPLHRWHGERDHSSFYTAVLNATCDTSATPELVAGLKQHVRAFCESLNAGEIPEELTVSVAPSDATIAALCTCLGLNVIVYEAEGSSTSLFPQDRIDQGPYILLIREAGVYSVVRGTDLVHGAFLTMRRHSGLVADLLALRQDHQPVGCRVSTLRTGTTARAVSQLSV